MHGGHPRTTAEPGMVPDGKGTTMSDTITITGNVATTPEFKRSGAGLPITTFRVASSQRKFDRATATWSEQGTNWYQVSTFRGLAEHAFASIRKGDRVILTGRLRVRQWDNGTKQGTSVDIDADSLGHDLLWGTTTFVKDASATRAAAPSSEEEWAAQSAEESESADLSTEWPVPVAPDDARELVDVETPY